MHLVIKWTPEAKQTFDNNIFYLKENWSEKEVAGFISRVETVLAFILKQPEMYSPSRQKAGVRKARINKRIDLYYKFLVETSEIHLLTFWNVKRDPSKLSF